MNLKDIEDKLVEDNPHLKRGVIKAALKAILDEIKWALDNDITVKLHEFGSFKRIETKLPGMTWLTEEQKQQKRTRVRFYPSKILKGAINAD